MKTLFFSLVCLWTSLALADSSVYLNTNTGCTNTVTKTVRTTTCKVAATTLTFEETQFQQANSVAGRNLAMLRIHYGGVLLGTLEGNVPSKLEIRFLDGTSNPSGILFRIPYPNTLLQPTSSIFAVRIWPNGKKACLLKGKFGTPQQSQRALFEGQCL